MTITHDKGADFYKVATVPKNHKLSDAPIVAKPTITFEATLGEYSVCERDLIAFFTSHQLIVPIRDSGTKAEITFLCPKYPDTPIVPNTF